MTDEQVRDAFAVGVRRMMAARRRGARHRHAWHPTPLEERRVNGMAAVAECFAGLELNREWLSTGDERDDDDAGDLAGGVCVRWTPRANGHLLINDTDRPHLHALLVTGARAHLLRLFGWMPVADAQQRQFWRTNCRSPCYWVPQDARGVWRPAADLRVSSPPLHAGEIAWFTNHPRG